MNYCEDCGWWKFNSCYMKLPEHEAYSEGCLLFFEKKDVDELLLVSEKRAGCLDLSEKESAIVLPAGSKAPNSLSPRPPKKR